MSRLTRTTVAVAAGLTLCACGSDSGNSSWGDLPEAPATTASSPSPAPPTTPAPSPTPTPTPTPSKPVARPKAAPPRCVGTFQNGYFTLRATNGAGIYGGSFRCGETGEILTVERMRRAIRFSAGSAVATVRPGRTVALAGYNLRVRFIRGSTAVFDVTTR